MHLAVHKTVFEMTAAPLPSPVQLYVFSAFSLFGFCRLRKTRGLPLVAVPVFPALLTLKFELHRARCLVKMWFSKILGLGNIQTNPKWHPSTHPSVQRWMYSSSVSRWWCSTSWMQSRLRVHRRTWSFQSLKQTLSPKNQVCWSEAHFRVLS